MIMLDDNTALVFNTDDLRDAVSSDNGVDTVFFGADITLGYGITIFPGKTSLVFDGTYLGVRYTFTDMDSLSSSQTIGVRAISNISITFQNIDLVGRNFYGIPYVPNGSAFNGISTLYHNVTYTGIQLTHNPFGFTRYTDCNITVNEHEVAETSELEIGGVTTLTKTVQSNAVFWFYGTSTRRPFLKILSGADVTISTVNYFMYELNPPEYTIEPGAKLTLSTSYGISNSAAHTISSFLVDENASFTYIQTTNAGHASLYIEGALTVNQGACFYMQADFSNTAQMLRFTGSSGALNLNNPKSFAIYNRGNSNANAFYFAAAIPFVITGGQINHWSAATAFPEAGTLEDEPQSKWNRPDWSRFTLQGTASNSQTNITSHDFTPEELEPLPPLTDLQLNTAKVFSVGDLTIEVYSAVAARRIAGITEPHANVEVIYYPSYMVEPHTAIADDNGMFTIVPTSPVPFSTYIGVYTNTPFLISWVTAVMLEDDELYIKEAPPAIRFPFKLLPGFEEKILAREFPEEPVVVVDTREPRSGWQLWVRITGPMKTEDNYVLDDAVVFAIQDGSLVTVGEDFVPVHQGIHSLADEFDVEWEEDKGVLARITGTVRSGKVYTTQLDWVVFPEGVEPDGSR